MEFSLVKSDIFNLNKDLILEDLFLGCSWKNKGFNSTDIDLSAVFLTENGRLAKIANFENKKTWLLEQSVYHYGDDLTGHDPKLDSDNEQIEIKLNRMPPSVKYIFVIANVSKGHLSNLKYCNLNIRPSSSGEKIVNICMKDLKTKGVIGAVIYRDGYNWRIKNLSIDCDSRSVGDFVFKCKQISVNGLQAQELESPIIQLKPIGIPWYQRILNNLFG